MPDAAIASEPHSRGIDGAGSGVAPQAERAIIWKLVSGGTLVPVKIAPGAQGFRR